MSSIDAGAAPDGAPERAAATRGARSRVVLGGSAVLLSVLIWHLSGLPARVHPEATSAPGIVQTAASSACSDLVLERATRVTTLQACAPDALALRLIEGTGRGDRLGVPAEALADAGE